MLQEIITKDIEYLIIFSLVLILPKILQRFKFPSGITALVIGICLASIDPSIQNDHLFRFLSQMGITSLFLFAGLEVDFEELKESKAYLGKYLLIFLLVLFVITSGVIYIFGLDIQNAFILSLGIFTPSAGFIMNSLHSFDINEDQEYWVRSKAISKEILAIALLFFALQGNDIKALAISLSFFIGLFLILPYIFKLFFKYISPYAPNSEIPFLVTLSLASGVISKELGAYYLVGAFIVGLIGSQFKKDIFKEGEETLFRSLSGFFSVFLPFYFFYAGMKLPFEKFTTYSVLIGIVMCVIFIPLRIFIMNYSLKHLKISFKVDMYKISLSLIPTLIFGLVISNILIDKGIISDDVIFGLVSYTLITSFLPAIFFLVLKRKKSVSI